MKPILEKPHWTTLTWLTALVLGFHLSFMVEGWGALVPANEIKADHSANADFGAQLSAFTTPALTSIAPLSTSLAPQPARVPLSTVRWIVDAKPPNAEALQPEERTKESKPLNSLTQAQKPATMNAAGQLAPSARSTTSDVDAHMESPASADHSNLTNTFAQTGTQVSPTAKVPRQAVDDAPTTAIQALQLVEPVHSETPTAAAVVAMLAAPKPASAEANNPAQAPTKHSESRTPALPPALPPASTRLVYDVTGSAKGLNYRANGSLDWARTNDRYSARMEVRVLLLGSRVQTSSGQVHANGLLPDRFSDKSRSERAAHFDRAQQTIRFSNNQPDATLQPGAQDRLSLFMQLAGLLQAQPTAYPVGHIISLQVAGTSDAETWRFRVAEEEILDLPVGKLRTRHLVRELREPRDSLIDIWFAPELAHLPVRIRITQDNGDRVDQQLSQMP